MMVKRTIFSAAVLLLLPVIVTSGVLFPRASETREVISLDGVWDFRVSPVNDVDAGFTELWYARGLKKSGEVLMMPVPSSFNDITQEAAIRDFTGWAWYEREFWVPTAWLNGDLRVKIRFGSVHYAAKVWVNGNLVAEHLGGHLPFKADITLHLSKNKKPNRVTVAVNNTLDANTIPQGEVTRPNNTDSYPPGYTINSYTFDFFNFAGIHRPVYLYTVPLTYIEDINVQSSIGEQGQAVVTYFVSTRQETFTMGTTPVCEVRIVDNEGGVVAASEGYELQGCSGHLTLDQPRLWWPVSMRPKDVGYLYTLEVTLVAKGSIRIIDRYRLPFGIRTIEWDNSHIFINKEPFYFRGMGRHEDTNIRGKGLDLVMAVKDHHLMQWLGANSYRTSHYPYSEESLDLSDRLGLVVVAESPAVNLVGFNKTLLARHSEVMRELVQRDKNRACVLMWSVANEARSNQKEAEPYFRDLVKLVKFLDPTRPITMATNRKYNTDRAAQFMDVLALNRYFAWYSDTGRLELVARQMEAEVRRWKKSFNKPLFISEYGADAVAGLHSDPPEVWTEDYQVAILHENFKAFDNLRKEGLLNGEMIWNFADFATAQVYTRVNGNKKGIFTRERQPKAAAHVLRKRYHQLAKMETSNITESNCNFDC